MDSIHDLGGKQGYGAIEVDEPEDPFHHSWEAREWGISRCARTPDITVDWWRHCRELIAPEDYLTRPYFDSWAQTDFSTYIEAGWLSLDEVDAGKSLPSGEIHDDRMPAMTLEQVLDEDRAHAIRFDSDEKTRESKTRESKTARFTVLNRSSSFPIQRRQDALGCER